MNLVDELINKTKVVSDDKEYWLNLHKEVTNFINGDNPKEDKDKLLKYGYIDKLEMIYRWYNNKTNK